MQRSTNSNNMKIVVFDSGVGGLTIGRALQAAIPSAVIINASDRDNFPYGTKSDELVRECASNFCERLDKEFFPNVIVVACNTASTVALSSIRDRVSCPIVGVVPAIKPAAKLSVSKVIGLLATPATVKRPYVDSLIAEFAADCHVVRVGSSALVEVAEDYVAGKQVSDELILSEISPLFHLPTDVIVLGCTHFPHLITHFEKLAPRKVKWLDSTQAIVERVKSVMDRI